jgi:hypothetical protein
MESQIRDLRYSADFRVKELEKRITHLENFVGWLTGLLIDVIESSLESPPRSLSPVTTIV